MRFRRAHSRWARERKLAEGKRVIRAHRGKTDKYTSISATVTGPSSCRPSEGQFRKKKKPICPTRHFILFFMTRCIFAIGYWRFNTKLTFESKSWTSESEVRRKSKRRFSYERQILDSLYRFNYFKTFFLNKYVSNIIVNNMTSYNELSNFTLIENRYKRK